MELNVENTTDNILFVTTNDFTIKDIVTNKVVDTNIKKEIFPPDHFTGDYILFLRLRPKISNDISGEKIQLTCEFDISSANDDACFSVVSTCSYGFTVDPLKQDKELNKLIQTWKDGGKSKDEIEFESKNWKLLDGKRIEFCVADSFDFIIQSIGIYSNVELVQKACNILIDKLNYFISKEELIITPSDNTLQHSFDIKLENEDYTIGKIIEYFFYVKYYETKILTFCGFNKAHPHTDYSIIRVAYKELPDISTVQANFKECLHDAIELFKKINNLFTKYG
jgi:DNA-directed RNA polymerase subunit L